MTIERFIISIMISKPLPKQVLKPTLPHSANPKPPDRQSGKTISWETIQRDFTQALCAQDQEFWQQRQAACYATLMGINFVKAIEPIPFPKRDRRGWVVLQSYDRQLELGI